MMYNKLDPKTVIHVANLVTAKIYKIGRKYSTNYLEYRPTVQFLHGGWVLWWVVGQRSGSLRCRRAPCRGYSKH